jgi:hypothetical protein
MKKPVIAALISLLVFPGTGQLYLGRVRRALAFILPAAVCASLLLRYTVSLADDIVAKVESGAMPLDLATISNAIGAAADQGPAWVSLLGWVLLACWLGSAVDAWMVGRSASAASV